MLGKETDCPLGLVTLRPCQQFYQMTVRKIEGGSGSVRLIDGPHVPYVTSVLHPSYVEPLVFLIKMVGVPLLI
jgi:hypothetical protein